MYTVQAFCHSLIAAIIVDRAIQSWEIRNPLIQHKFRLITLLFPVFSFPIFQMINPERGNIYFREDIALFDINRWLALEIWGKIPISLLFLLILTVTTLIFLFQEIIPILRHTFDSKNSNILKRELDKDSVVNEAIQSIPVNRPELFIIEDDEPLLYSTSGTNPAVFLSTGLINTLDRDHLQAALAHEIAHIMWRKSLLVWFIFFARILMFFNPVILVEFRRIVQEEEKICDDMAVSLTQKPLALADTLKRLYYVTENLSPFKLTKPSRIKMALEDYSHNILIESRISRLEKEGLGDLVHKKDGEWFKFSLVLTVILIINYFVV